jgi:hypothetical protein
MLAKEQTPVLAGVIPVFEIFMTKWEVLASKKPWLKPFINEGLKWAEKYYIRSDLTNAYVIAMCEFVNRLYIFHSMRPCS